MIQANELRIGNYIQHEVKGLIVVNGIEPHCLDYSIRVLDGSWVYLKNCTKVPLTEERLLKFGFKKKLNDNKVSYNKHNIIIHFVNGIFTEYVHQKQIKYVHKLQSLFFEIRGVELSGF